MLNIFGSKNNFLSFQKSALYLFIFSSLFLSVTTSNASKKISLQLAWKHQFQFAGYYAALHKGYYQEAGLEVTIVEGGQGKFAREELLKGRVQYGIAGSELLLHRKDGEPFVVLAPIFQHSPSILLTRKDSGISNLQDLIGKKVMLLPGKKDADILAAFLNEGIPFDSFQRLDQSYNLDDLIEGRTDAISAYITNEPWHLLQKNVEPGVISPQTYGVDFYSDCLFTTEKEIKKYPQRVDHFLRATLQGWEYAMTHPDEIIDILLKEYGVKKGRQHLKYEAKAIRKIMRPQMVQIGHMNPGRWHHIAKTYEELGLLEANFPWDGFLYAPTPKSDFFRLKKIVAIAIAVIILLCLGSATLFFFNRKLSMEINQRKEAEKKLIKNEVLFRGLYDNMTSGSAIYEVINDGSKGSDYIVKNFNKKSLEIEGKTLDQVVEKSLADLRPNIDDYGLIPLMKRVWETGEADYFPIKVYQDKIFSNYYENYIFKIPTGEVVTIYNDVTDQKNSELALKESEKRFALAMEFANDGIFDWNLETDEVYYSPGWKRILGYKDDELTNHITAWERLTDPEDAKRSWKMVNELINRERDKFEIEFKMKHKAGHWVDILARANAIFDQNNKAFRIIGTHVDISERKKLENQLFQSRKLESIGSLAGGLAHEFNNILSIIIGNNELIMAKLPELSLVGKNCEKIHLAGLRARDIVRHLLTFSRQNDSIKKPLNIVSVVIESLRLIRSTTPTNIKIKETLCPNCLPIWGDETQINQILINLCSNAIDALPISGGIIDIELCNSDLTQHNDVSANQLAMGKYIKLRVKDNGSGIPKTIHDRIFEPYFTTKDVGKGSGIGLAVVHGIVENHGGSIVCESKKNQGTAFTILIPAYEGPVETKPYNTEMPYGNGESILYVDDESALAELTRLHLKSLGYDAYSTTDPKEALEIIKAEPNRFDLVVSDMAMPNIPGDQLIVEILSINPEMPTMICSGYSSRMSDTKASEIGVKAFVMKPLRKAELAKKVRDVLDDAN